MNVRIIRSLQLTDNDTGGQTSTVGEPSVTSVGQQLLITGNWYAARSMDNGQQWQALDPFSFFPTAGADFCCDQTVHHNSGHELTFWLLQYAKTTTGNTLRLAIKQGETLHDNDWFWWDLIPSQVNSQWQNEWFDYNHAALSDNFLYVVSNAFTITDDKWTRSVVFRLSLADLSQGTNLTIQFFQSTENFSLRCVNGARDVMYFGSNQVNGQLRLFRWPEQETTATLVDLTIAPWRGGRYSAPGPDNADWLSRCDPRITGAWLSEGVIGFMWSVNSTAERPMPHIRVVRIAEATRQLIDEPDIWSPDFAYAYPDACPNEDGLVGISLFRGGGTLHPGHVVGIWNPATNAWVLQASRNGTHGPADGKWGDYTTCRRFSANTQEWLATGFTLQGGGSRNDVQPCVIHFSPDTINA